MMFEKQCKSDAERLKASSSAFGNDFYLSSDVIKDSPGKNEMDSLWSQHGKTEASRVNGNPAPEESSQNMSLEHRISQSDSPEKPGLDNCDSTSQPAKRPRTDA